MHPSLYTSKRLGHYTARHDCENIRRFTPAGRTGTKTASAGHKRGSGVTSFQALVSWPLVHPALGQARQHHREHFSLPVNGHEA